MLSCSILHAVNQRPLPCQIISFSGNGHTRNSFTLNHRAHRPSDVVTLHNEYLAIPPLTAPHPCRLRRRAHVIFMSHDIRRVLLRDNRNAICVQSAVRFHFDAQQDPSRVYKMAVIAEFALASPSHHLLDVEIRHTYQFYSYMTVATYVSINVLCSHRND